MKLNTYCYEDIEKGSVHSFDKTILEEDLTKFGELTGDYNPLHCDAEYAKRKGFDDKVVYGMLAGSLFSTLVGMICPGEKNLYLSQTLQFRKPTYVGEKISIVGEIIDKTDSIQVITIKTIIKAGDIVKIDGVAKVKILDG